MEVTAAVPTAEGPARAITPPPVCGRSAASAFYLEIRPLARHRPLIDSLYILCDCGRLTGSGRYRFASPLADLVLLCRTDSEGCPGPWSPVVRPPGAGGARRRPFHGWMAGVRCRPDALPGGGLVLPDFPSPPSQGPLDGLLAALDAWGDRLSTVFSPGRPSFPPAVPLPDVTSVAAMAAASGVSPRTLHRQVMARTGLAPKRYILLNRFRAALERVAFDDAGLAEVAADVGYADQAHMTMEFGRHSGLSPCRFRAQARRVLSAGSVRFFKDTSFADRIGFVIREEGPSPG